MKNNTKKFVGLAVVFAVALVAFFVAHGAQAGWKKEGILLGEGSVAGGLRTEKKLIIPSQQGVIYLYSGDGSLYLQKLNSEGEKMWGESGILIIRDSDFGSTSYGQIVSDGFGGVIVAFESKNKNYVQRVNKYGKKQWGKIGKVVGSASVGFSSIISSKNGSAVVHVPTDSGLLTKKFNYRGQIIWSTNISKAYIHPVQLESMIADAQNNIYALGYVPSTVANLYKMNSQGKILWSKKLSPNFYVNSRLLKSEDGIIIVGGKWDDVKNNVYKGNLYAQKFDWSGNPKWSGDSVKVSGFTDRIFNAFDIVSDKKGGVLVTWSDERSDGKGDIYAQRINRKGKVIWGKADKLISGSESRDALPRAISDKKGGMIIGWIKGQKTINFQRISRNKKILWKEKQLESPASYGYEHEIATTNNKNEIIVIAQAGADTLYAYKLDRSGNILGE